MSRKVLLIRFWLLVTIAGVLVAVWPECAILLAFFPGQSGCFCCGAASCIHCNTGTTPFYTQLELSGITNGDCSSCTSFNATWILTQQSNSCNWDYVDGPLPCSWTNLEVLVTLVLGNGSVAVGGNNISGGGNDSFSFSGLLNGTGATPVDCSALAGNSFTPGSDGGTDCVTTAATAVWDNI